MKQGFLRTQGLRWLGGRSRHGEIWVGDISWCDAVIAVVRPYQGSVAGGVPAQVAHGFGRRSPPLQRVVAGGVCGALAGDGPLGRRSWWRRCAPRWHNGGGALASGAPLGRRVTTVVA